MVSGSTPNSTRTLWGRRMLRLGLLVTGLAAVAWLTVQAPGSSNDASRLATVDALVNSGTFAIDQSAFDYTVDKIQVDGRFYSDKPPLLSLYLTGLFWLMQTVFGWTMADDLSLIYYSLTLLSSGIAFVATLAGVRRLAEQLGAGLLAATGIAVASCGATLLLPYATVINSQAVASPFLVWFVVGLLRELQETSATPEPSDSLRPHLRVLGTGLLGGAAIVTAPSTSVFVFPALVGSTLAGVDVPRLPWLVAGILALLIPHFLITYFISGHLLLLNLEPGQLTGTRWAHDSLAETLVYAYHSLVGYRGAVLYNLPAAFGSGFLVWMCLQESNRWFWLSVLLGAVLFFVLTIGFSSNYSGNTYGIRWHVACAPLMSAFLAAGFDHRPRFTRQLATGGLAVSILVGAPVAALGTVGPWVPSSGDQYSPAEMVSGERKYVRSHASRAVDHLEAGRYLQAQKQANHVIRRAPHRAVGWEVGIRASIQLGDTRQLRNYRRRLQADRDGMAIALTHVFVQRIDEALARFDHE